MGLASSTASPRYSSHPHGPTLFIVEARRGITTPPCAAAIRKNRYRRTKCITIQADMEGRILVMVRGATSLCPASMTHNFILKHRRFESFSKLHFTHFHESRRGCTSSAALQPSDVSRLAETARISLTANEDVDLQSVEPCIRADTEDSNSRDDVPEAFDKRDTMIAAVPSFEEPYIKVPKVLNMEYSIYF